MEFYYLIKDTKILGIAEQIHNIDYFVDMVVQMRKGYEPDNIIKDSVRKPMDWKCIKDEVYLVFCIAGGKRPVFRTSCVYTIFDFFEGFVVCYILSGYNVWYA